MAFLTDRKRAEGMGAAKSGAEHHWHMTISSVALTILVPLFLFTFGSILGSSYDEVVAYYQRPFPAIVAALTFGVGFMHFKSGVQVLIEDYIHGALRQPLLLAMICLSYTLAGIGIFAVARIAL